MNAELFQAVKSGDLAQVQRLFETPDVDALDQYSGTPLLEAIQHSHTPIVEILLAHGAAVNGPVGAYRTPLQQACYSEKADIVSLLIEHGLAVDGTTHDDRITPLTLACWPNTPLSIAQLLINAGADVNGGEWSAPLHDAAVGGNIEALDLLIQSGADVNSLSTDDIDLPAGSTALHFAADNVELSSLHRLLAAGSVRSQYCQFSRSNSTSLCCSMEIICCRHQCFAGCWW